MKFCSDKGGNSASNTESLLRLVRKFNVHVRVLIWSLTQSVSVFVKQIRNEAHEYFRVTIEKKKIWKSGKDKGCIYF